MESSEYHYRHARDETDHEMWSPTPMTRCVAMTNGKPCTRPIIQVGGPRAARNHTAPSQNLSEAIEKLPASIRRRLAPQAPRR